MQEPFEKFPKEDELKKSEPGHHREVFSDNEFKIEQKTEKEKPEQTEQKIKETKRNLKEVFNREQLPKIKEESPEVKKARIEQYQERYLPKHLRKKTGIVSKVITGFWTGREKFEREGGENMPENGPFVAICNHFGGGDAEALLKTFRDADLHLAVGKEIFWEKSPILKWLFEKLRMIPIEESLSNISEEEKEKALERQDKHGRAVFRKIIDKEKQGEVAINKEFVRQAVATLSRGDAVGIFPEGLWLDPQGPKKDREKAEMKQGYRGIELVASQYKKLTGEDLPIIPTAFIEDKTNRNKKLVIGESLSLNNNDSGASDTDWCMANVAALLPEEQRGYYKEMAK